MQTPIECPECGRFYRADKLSNCPGCSARKAEVQEKSNQTSSPISSSYQVSSTTSDLQQPTYQQMESLIDELREIKNSVNSLRWFMYGMFFILIIDLLWIGVTVNLSPTTITSFSE